jgi:hypothetical protein
LKDPVGVRVAMTLLARANPRKSGSGRNLISAKGLFGTLRRAGEPASRVEAWLVHFLRAGWVRLTWRLQGTRRTLLEIETLDGSGLEEYARPGHARNRKQALAEARQALSGADHPVVFEAHRLLALPDETSKWTPEFIHALSEVALHASRGDVLAERVFSARFLGNSKVLASYRSRLEKLVGPLESLGIREGAPLVLVGGKGVVRLEKVELDLACIDPFMGLSRETMLSCVDISFPNDGLLAVENLAAFESCCLGEVPGTGDVLLVWTAGYPGRGVQAVVNHAKRKRATVRVWADIDLDGVRIARLIGSWSPERFGTFRMSAEDVMKAPSVQSLSLRSLAAIQAELKERPSAILADTLRILADRNSWVEQEVFLGPTRRR